MSLFSAALLFGAGYIFKDQMENRKYRTHKVPEQTIADYLRDVAIDKMDQIFYCKNSKQKGSIKANQYRDIYEPDVETIYFEWRLHAEYFLDKLKDIRNEYKFVSVSDYYMADGRDIPEYNCDTYGWTYELDNAKVAYDRDQRKYYVKLPKPKYVGDQ